jgi:hypothetical protein
VFLGFDRLLYFLDRLVFNYHKYSPKVASRRVMNGKEVAFWPPSGPKVRGRFGAWVRYQGGRSRPASEQPRGAVLGRRGENGTRFETAARARGTYYKIITQISKAKKKKIKGNTTLQTPNKGHPEDGTI